MLFSDLEFERILKICRLFGSNEVGERKLINLEYDKNLSLLKQLDEPIEEYLGSSFYLPEKNFVIDFKCIINMV